jgi:hypothetical protein
MESFIIHFTITGMNTLVAAFLIPLGIITCASNTLQGMHLLPATCTQCQKINLAPSNPIAHLTDTFADGLAATFLSNYLHTIILHAVLIVFIVAVYLSPGKKQNAQMIGQASG